MQSAYRGVPLGAALSPSRSISVLNHRIALDNESQICHVFLQQMQRESEDNTERLVNSEYYSRGK